MVARVYSFALARKGRTGLDGSFKKPEEGKCSSLERVGGQAIRWNTSSVGVVQERVEGLSSDPRSEPWLPQSHTAKL